jgi:hypothetical protein
MVSIEITVPATACVEKLIPQFILRPSPEARPAVVSMVAADPRIVDGRERRERGG